MQSAPLAPSISDRIETAKAAMEKASAKHRKGYDPGNPGKITSLGGGEYLVESFKGNGSYRTTRNRCGCDHHQRTGKVCKHQIAVRDYEARLSAERARRVAEKFVARYSTEELLRITREAKINPVALDVARTEVLGRAIEAGWF